MSSKYQRFRQAQLRKDKGKGNNDKNNNKSSNNPKSSILQRMKQSHGDGKLRLNDLHLNNLPIEIFEIYTGQQDTKWWDAHDIIYIDFSHNSLTFDMLQLSTLLSWQQVFYPTLKTLKLNFNQLNGNFIISNTMFPLLVSFSAHHNAIVSINFQTMHEYLIELDFRPGFNSEISCFLNCLRFLNGTF